MSPPNIDTEAGSGVMGSSPTVHRSSDHGTSPRSLSMRFNRFFAPAVPAQTASNTAGESLASTVGNSESPASDPRWYSPPGATRAPELVLGSGRTSKDVLSFRHRWITGLTTDKKEEETSVAGFMLSKLPRLRGQDADPDVAQPCALLALEGDPTFLMRLTEYPESGTQPPCTHFEVLLWRGSEVTTSYEWRQPRHSRALPDRAKAIEEGIESLRQTIRGTPHPAAEPFWAALRRTSFGISYWNTACAVAEINGRLHEDDLWHYCPRSDCARCDCRRGRETDFGVPRMGAVEAPRTAASAPQVAGTKSMVDSIPGSVAGFKRGMTSRRW